MPDKLTVSTDKIAYHNICLELLKELFEEIPKKDREILGHSYALFGYKRKNLDKLCLEHMMTADGIIKARKAAIKKMQENYPNNSLRLWKSFYHTVMCEAETVVLVINFISFCNTNTYHNTFQKSGEILKTAK